MKVLAGIDGSERSNQALQFGARLLSAKVDDIVIYFSPPDFKLSSHSELAPEIPEHAREALAETVFKAGISKLPKELQPLAETMIGENHPADGVLAAAEETDADLILIGSHSTSRRLPVLLGGTARKIAHRSPKPVLVVRERESVESTDSLKVLIACDDAGLWRHAAARLRDFSWPDNTETTLLHVVELMIDDGRYDDLPEDASTSIPEFPSLIEEYRAQTAQQRAEKLASLEADRKGMPSIVENAEVKVTSGSVVERIVREVRENSVDLVVVGARRLGPMGRIFASTTERLLYQCPCSLLVIHEHDKP